MNHWGIDPVKAVSTPVAPAERAEGPDLIIEAPTEAGTRLLLAHRLRNTK